MMYKEMKLVLYKLLIINIVGCLFFFLFIVVRLFNNVFIKECCD